MVDSTFEELSARCQGLQELSLIIKYIFFGKTVKQSWDSTKICFCMKAQKLQLTFQRFDTALEIFTVSV